MINKNLILYLPFDDPDGGKAYDFSHRRNDVTLSNGATLVKDAIHGKALALNGGEAQTVTGLPFGSDFTLCLYAKTEESKLSVLLNFSGVDHYLEKWIDVTPGEYTFLAFVKSGGAFKVFKNKDLVYTADFQGTPIGLSVNDGSLSESTALLDEVMVYDKALSFSEILKIQASTDVEYYINGKNFKEFGVYVSDHSGLVGKLEQKERLTVDWDDYHGRVRDKKNKRYKERYIVLDCFIEASSRSAFVEWQELFLDQFAKDGTQRLTVEYDGKAKPLVYEVDMPDQVDPKAKWGSYNDEMMVGTFQLKLVEDEPVKRVLRHISTAANSVSTINFSCLKMLNIYWGDGKANFNLSGENKTVTHTYAEPGEYDIVITGVIEKITDFTTNDIVIWNKLS